MPGIYTQIPKDESVNFIKQSWLRLNLIYLGVGIAIGLTLSLLISAFNGSWIGFRSFAFEMLFSVIISLGISNSIKLSHRLLKINRDRFWASIAIYYASSIVGMIIAIEMIYLLKAWLFNEKYHFFHTQDIAFSSVIAMVICTVIYLYQSQKERLNAQIQSKNLDVLKLNQMKTQAELATLQSKINPHFLYNSLNAIASLIHEDPDKAESMTLKLSKLFRYTINHNQDDLVPVKEELDIVGTYLDIEKVRFGDRINFIIEAEEEALPCRIPRFLIQPLVENALKHGLKDVITQGELKVSISKKERIEIMVSDNGIPFPEVLDIGYGLQSTYDKLDLLYDGNYEVQISNDPVKQITIKIPCP
jgi:two-component system LytT family sensor kinase